jgi:hypothetical protein
MVGTAILRVAHQVIQKEDHLLIHVLHDLLHRLHMDHEQLLLHEKEVHEAHTEAEAVLLHHALQTLVLEAAHMLLDQADHEAEDTLAEDLHLLTDRIAEADILAEAHLLEDAEADERCQHSTHLNSSTRTLLRLLRRYT